MRTRLKNERGAALIETAITLPLILLVSVSIFEFGRAYQTWQVLTNAAREGARVAVIVGTTDEQVRTVVRNYMKGGGLPVALADAAAVDPVRDVAFGVGNASRVTVTYPFSFMMLNPVMRMVTASSTAGQGVVSMQASALMRNEN